MIDEIDNMKLKEILLKFVKDAVSTTETGVILEAFFGREEIYIDIWLEYIFEKNKDLWIDYYDKKRNKIYKVDENEERMFFS